MSRIYGTHVLLAAWLVACGSGPATPSQSTSPPSEAFLQTFDSMQDVQAAWTLSSWTNATRTHSPANVSVTDGILQLKLSGSAPGTLPVCAEVVSRKNDFFYGTYRASIRVTGKPGSVVGWFTYLGDPLNEIDVEFLSRQPRTAFFTLHHVQTSVDSATRELSFDPSAAFHEYRFDWYKDRVDYYVDGQLLATLTKNVPDRPSRLLLNHWSGNLEKWGGQAPADDAVIEVDWAYYASDYRAPLVVSR